jgi:hypothetical protein
MEADVVTDDDDAWRDAVHDELLQLIDDMLHTEKTHLAAAERLQTTHRWWGIIATISSSAAAGTIVTSWNDTVAGILALVAAIVSGVLTFTAPERAAERHLVAGRQLAAIRTDARQLVNLDLAHTVPAEIRTRVADVTSRKSAIDRGAPATSEKDYRIAQRKIRNGTFERD